MTHFKVLPNRMDEVTEYNHEETSLGYAVIGTRCHWNTKKVAYPHLQNRQCSIWNNLEKVSFDVFLTVHHSIDLFQ